ncbi:hypothetical protein PDE_02279 [Penicillium oxalicum 114-2]|uniref:Uncharacterized protein n=1 Tax=Penicillium oxalicum (strain 114-2 / CGMCC 5302) TaxID=933388 RepID=S7ZFD5_PENO1|nr:hypothetical protein PDE_02279 [Penicillium oxalicum 114-2]
MGRLELGLGLAYTASVRYVQGYRQYKQVQNLVRLEVTTKVGRYTNMGSSAVALSDICSASARAAIKRVRIHPTDAGTKITRTNIHTSR